MAGMNIESVRSARRAATILAHPLRARILGRAQTPISASDLARHLGQPRQRVNYHVRQLAQHGFLQPAAQQRKRNMVEQQYVASARAYVLAPDVLGELAPDPAHVQDSASATHLVALCARAQSELVSVVEAANAAGVRVRTVSLQSDLRFESAEQRGEFTRELLDAVADVIARHSTPVDDTTGAHATGPSFRLLLGCYPAPM
jgi:hypothetical protein